MTDDRRTPDHGYTLSSPHDPPIGSGELKWVQKVPVNNVSVMSGRSHLSLDIYQYSWELMCVAQ